jgi:TetR/AcrR family transcriptional regulator, transcriptional repressor for nem operon
MLCQVTNSLDSGGRPAPPGRLRGNAGQGEGKRERLVAAARRVLYENGVEKATLADIAAAADVPLGNVYYYFKTKDALVTAVIESYQHSYHEMSAKLNQQDRPAGRLKALVRALTARRDQLASYGCPIGSLSSELDKREDALRGEAGTILARLIDWAEVQFRAMGRDDARELAVALIAAYEGIALLAATLRDPGLISAEGGRLERWIDSLTERPTPPGSGPESS